MENLINSFLDYLKLERACSPGTVLKYGAHLLDFERYLKDVDEELTLETATGDLVRGIRRASETDTVLSVHVPGPPDGFSRDPKLAETWCALTNECRRLGVTVSVFK